MLLLLWITLHWWRLGQAWNGVLKKIICYGYKHGAPTQIVRILLTNIVQKNRDNIFFIICKISFRAKYF